MPSSAAAGSSSAAGAGPAVAPDVPGQRQVPVPVAHDPRASQVGLQFLLRAQGVEGADDVLEHLGVHVAAERVTPLAIPLMVVIGREAAPGGSADDALLAQSAVDRFKNNAFDLVIEGESYRGRLKPGQKAGQKPEKKGKKAAASAASARTRHSSGCSAPRPSGRGAC